MKHGDHGDEFIMKHDDFRFASEPFNTAIAPPRLDAAQRMNVQYDTSNIQALLSMPIAPPFCEEREQNIDSFITPTSFIFVIFDKSVIFYDVIFNLNAPN